MLFTPDNAQKVIKGLKTQTRRPQQETDEAWIYDLNPHTYSVVLRNGRQVWQIGKTYAVQPGRGKPALWVNWNHPCYGIDVIEDIGKARPDDREMVKGQGYAELRIRIKAIRPERLQDISEEDALADGGWKYSNCPIHKNPVASFSALWDSINGKRPGCSWDDNPQVWVLEFTTDALSENDPYAS